VVTGAAGISTVIAGEVAAAIVVEVTVKEPN
jgi:hypothetical protein